MGALTKSNINNLFATLRKIDKSLNCLKGSSSVNITTLCDGTTNALVGYRVAIYDASTGAFNVTYYDDTWASIPSAPVGSVDCAKEDIDVKSIMLCDDQGGGTIVRFMRFYWVDPGSNDLFVVGDYTPDLTADYTVLGTVGECEAGQSRLQYVLVNGAVVWSSLPATALMVGIDVLTISVPGTPSTLQTTTGTSNLIQGMKMEWDIGGESTSNLEGTFTLDVKVNDVIAVWWTELV